MQVSLPREEFAEDLDLRLGRANGNIYLRKPGVEGVHDGQVMVRLKKKRFVILDYSVSKRLQCVILISHVVSPYYILLGRNFLNGPLFSIVSYSHPPICMAYTDRSQRNRYAICPNHG